MKRAIIFFFIAIMIAGCSQPQVEQNSETFTCPDGTEVEDSSQCDLPEAPEGPEGSEDNVAPPAPETKEEEQQAGVDPAVDELIQIAEEKVNSFSFVYVGPPENLPRNTYYVKGDNVAVELLKDTNFKLTQPYTHVYFHANDNVGVAYCAARDTSRCPNGTVSHGEVDWEEYAVRTPYQWLKEMQSAEIQGNGPQYEKRATTKVKFTTSDQSGIMYIVNFFELPGKIVLDNGDTIEFRDLSINSVKGEQVLPPK